MRRRTKVIIVVVIALFFLLQTYLVSLVFSRVKNMKKSRKDTQSHVHLFGEGNGVIEIGFSDPIIKTNLITLKARALGSTEDHPILYDPFSLELVKKIGSRPFEKLGSPHGMFVLSEGVLMRLLTCRAKAIDNLYGKYLSEAYQAGKTVVTTDLATGLDTRFDRLGDDGKTIFNELDLSGVIGVRKLLGIGETERRKFLPFDVRNTSGWMGVVKGVAAGENNPNGADGNVQYIFLAEGLLMYLQKKEVEDLFMDLHRNFPGCIIIFDVFNNLKKKQFLPTPEPSPSSSSEEDNIEIPPQTSRGYNYFSMDDNAEIEKWSSSSSSETELEAGEKDIRLLEAWYHFDCEGLRKVKGGWIWYVIFNFLLRLLPVLKNTHRVLVYRL